MRQAMKVLSKTIVAWLYLSIAYRCLCVVTMFRRWGSYFYREGVYKHIQVCKGERLTRKALEHYKIRRQEDETDEELRMRCLLMYKLTKKMGGKANE